MEDVREQDPRISTKSLHLSGVPKRPFSGVRPTAGFGDLHVTSGTFGQIRFSAAYNIDLSAGFSLEKGH